jgi:hypothetical protein
MRSVKFSHRFATAETDDGAALLSAGELAAFAAIVDAAARKIEERGIVPDLSEDERRRRENLAVLDLPYSYGTDQKPTMFTETLTRAKDVMAEGGARIRNAGGHYVHLGIGGSALGSKLLVEAPGRRAGRRHPRARQHRSQRHRRDPGASRPAEDVRQRREQERRYGRVRREFLDLPGVSRRRGHRR